MHSSCWVVSGFFPSCFSFEVIISVHLVLLATEPNEMVHTAVADIVCVAWGHFLKINKQQEDMTGNLEILFIN